VTEYIEATVDKFIFKVATDRYYSSDGVWAKLEGNLVRLGISDFLQQRNGDIAFATLKSAGSPISLGDEIAALETIKVNISLPAPISGEIMEANPVVETEPERINQDPYGRGWLILVKPADWEKDRSKLMEAASYFEKMKRDAEQEIGNK